MQIFLNGESQDVAEGTTVAALVLTMTDDPRGITCTGGMSFFGGPGNNYSSHGIAALHPKLREAGGLVTDADGGEDWLRGGHIVASGPALHGALRERVEH